MSRAAQVVFAALVLATLGTFLVTQRLKQAPRLVKTLTVTREFSPALGFRKASIQLRLKHSDEATVTVVGPNGDGVRRLVHNRRLAAGQRVQLLWDGRDDAGQIVPDGVYKVRVGLHDQGRSVTLLSTITADSTPPRPIVRLQRPQGATGPPILPLPHGAAVRFAVGGDAGVGRPRFTVYRNDGPRPRPVQELATAPGARTGAWDGLILGKPALPGTYVIVARLKDRAGNVGASFPFTPRHPGEPPGGAGVTVRYLAAQTPLQSVQAGSAATVFVDARRARYAWRLRRLGSTHTVARGHSRRPVLRPSAPQAPSGVYLLDLSAGTRRASVPIAVNGRGRQPVLLVLPLVDWQGTNPVDDDGDGVPDTLLTTGHARIARPFAGAGQPPAFATQEGPLLRYLDRPRQAFDLQTDYAVARASRGYLGAYRGVVIAGDEHWIEPRLAARLLSYVRGGGKLFSLGTDSLRRQARVSAGMLIKPTGESAFDVFGTGLRAATAKGDLLAGQDAIGLFDGTDGQFSGFSRLEETVSPGTGAKIVSVAQTSDGKPVIVAERVGRGLVIRTGLPEWEQRLGDADVATMTRRVWKLLSR